MVLLTSLIVTGYATLYYTVSDRQCSTTLLVWACNVNMLLVLSISCSKHCKEDEPHAVDLDVYAVYLALLLHYTAESSL